MTDKTMPPEIILAYDLAGRVVGLGRFCVLGFGCVLSAVFFGGMGGVVPAFASGFGSGVVGWIGLTPGRGVVFGLPAGGRLGAVAGGMGAANFLSFAVGWETVFFGVEAADFFSGCARPEMFARGWGWGVVGCFTSDFRSGVLAGGCFAAGVLCTGLRLRGSFFGGGITVLVSVLIMTVVGWRLAGGDGGGLG